MQKAQALSSFQDLLKTQTIKKQYFVSGKNQCTTLTILTEKVKEKKKKDKKSKKTNVDSDLNSEDIL